MSIDNRKNFARLHGRPVLAGQTWHDIHGTARVMAVAEGYAMMRRNNCMPFAIPVKALDENWRIDVPGVI
jgi:hypothetical protein